MKKMPGAQFYFEIAVILGNTNIVICINVILKVSMYNKNISELRKLFKLVQ